MYRYKRILQNTVRYNIYSFLTAFGR